VILANSAILANLPETNFDSLLFFPISRQ